MSDIESELAALRAEIAELRERQVIKAERIDIVEPDGTLRLSISNAARSPGGTVAGEKVRPDGVRDAGIIFFNREGNENGGLQYGGPDAEGRAGAILTMDRHNEDQVLMLHYQEDGRDRSWATGIRLMDRPTFTAAERLAFVRKVTRAQSLRAEEGAAELAEIGQRLLGQSSVRLDVWRSFDGAAELLLRDALGRVRLRLSVSADGGAAIDFLDESGQIVKTVGPEGAP